MMESVQAQSNDAQTLQVRFEPEHGRYSLWLGDENVGLADYTETGRGVHFTHAEVDPAHRGQGLASVLVERALDHTRTRTGKTVFADCPYVAYWVDRHAEYHDLLTRGR